MSDLTTVIAPGDIIRIQPVEKNGTTTWRFGPTSRNSRCGGGNGAHHRQHQSLSRRLRLLSQPIQSRALQSARQPGSSFKPFIYSAALANGVNAADVFLDAPLVFEDANLESQYRPENDNNRYNGPTRLREALYRSINLVSIRVLLEVGAGKVLDHVGNFGFDTSSFPRNTQLAIGGGTMTVAPLDMSRAYAVLANGGHLVEPNIIDRIVDQQGETVYLPARVEVCTDCDSDQDSASQTQPTAAGFSEPSTLEEFAAEIPEAVDQREIIPATRVIDERNAFIVDSMLKDVIKRGTGRRAKHWPQRLRR